MSHYCCKACTQRYDRCVCPPTPTPPPKTWWVIDKDKWLVRESKPYVMLDVFLPKYETREEAEADIPRLLTERREELMAEVAMIDTMLRMNP